MYNMWHVLGCIVCNGLYWNGLHVMEQIVHIEEYWLVLYCICVYWY